jgi:hypothetical protein
MPPGRALDRAGYLRSAARRHQLQAQASCPMLHLGGFS